MNKSAYKREVVTDLNEMVKKVLVEKPPGSIAVVRGKKDEVCFMLFIFNPLQVPPKGVIDCMVETVNDFSEEVQENDPCS